MSGSHCRRVSQAQHDCHLGLDQSSLGAVLCGVGCLVASDRCILDANSSTPSSCDNQKYIQTLPNVPRGSKSPPVQINCPTASMSLLFIVVFQVHSTVPGQILDILFIAILEALSTNNIPVRCFAFPPFDR